VGTSSAAGRYLRTEAAAQGTGGLDQRRWPKTSKQGLTWRECGRGGATPTRPKKPTQVSFCVVQRQRTRSALTVAAFGLGRVRDGSPRKLQEWLAPRTHDGARRHEEYGAAVQMLQFKCCSSNAAAPGIARQNSAGCILWSAASGDSLVRRNRGEQESGPVSGARLPGGKSAMRRPKRKGVLRIALAISPAGWYLQSVPSLPRPPGSRFPPPSGSPPSWAAAMLG
jgi:hypothetical protein